MLRNSIQAIINFYYTEYPDEFENLNSIIEFAQELLYDINIYFKDLFK
jgi:hypothetical protein